MFVISVSPSPHFGFEGGSVDKSAQFSGHCLPFTFYIYVFKTGINGIPDKLIDDLIKW